MYNAGGMNGGELLRKTVIYRIIALIFSMVFAYFILGWSERHPEIDKKVKSVMMGFAGWMLGTLVYYGFEYFYNGGIS